MAKFKVNKIFELEKLPSPILAGEIVEGTVRKGMVAKVLVDSELYQVSEIVGVEFVDYPGGKSDAGLALKFDDKESEAVFFELCQVGDIIRIENE